MSIFGAAAVAVAFMKRSKYENEHSLVWRMGPTVNPIPEHYTQIKQII